VSLKFLGLAMIIIGIGLAAVTAWFWKAARPDPEVLAPLEIMGDREFVKANEKEKTRLLNAVKSRKSVNQLPDPTNN
jgi:hypothetical protein